MEGIFIRDGSEAGKDQGIQGLSLLAKFGKTEIMSQYICTNAVVWLVPGVTDETFEFFFVHSGSIRLGDEDDCEILKAGDCFFTNKLKKDVQVRCLEDALLLYISNNPIFDESAYWRKTLGNLVNQIDKMDHYTKQHSNSVMRYATAIREKLIDECSSLSTEDFVLAALFHDVGKCNTPPRILLKPARLTKEEYEIMKHHPIDSANILEPIFGSRIASLARMHHERMDGSGYPLGLKGDQIPLEARILMVADAFDAITSKRVYSDVRSYAVGIEELRRFPEQYDMHVVDALAGMVDDGSILRCSDHDR